MIVLDRDVQFSGQSAGAVGQKLHAFHSRCAAHGVDCHIGPGDVAFGKELVVTYSLTLTGDAGAIERALGPRAPGPAKDRRALPARFGIRARRPFRLSQAVR